MSNFGCKEIKRYDCVSKCNDDPSVVNVGVLEPVTWDAADTLLGLDAEKKPVRIQKPDFTADVYTREETDTLLDQKAGADDIEAAMEPVNERVDGIDALIPATATPDNKLADQGFVNSSIEATAARPLTYDAAGNPFPTKALLNGATTFYNNGVAVTPTENDYVVVQADETQNGGQVRYGYDGTAWVFRYKINDAPFTELQNAAINSGITNLDKLEIYNLKTTVKNLIMSTTSDPVAESLAKPSSIIVYRYQSYMQMYCNGLPVSNNSADLIPVMYSNTLPAPFEVSASSNTSIVYSSFRKYVGDLHNYWNSKSVYENGIGSEYITIKLDVARIIVKFVIVPGYYSRRPIGIVLSASNDNINFTNITTITSIIYDGSVGKLGSTNAVKFTTPYQYYKFTFTNILTDQSIVSVGCIYLYGY